MPGISIKPATVAELQRQLNEELTNVHAYLALAIWCDKENFKGFAQYFYKQTGEERKHAQKFTKHLLDRGVLPALTAIDAPKVEFKSLLEVAKQAQTLEAATTQWINTVYQAALKDGDLSAQVFLHWFINEQVEEETWADEMVDRIERATCAGSLGELDRHIERYLSEKTSGE